jgi:hypothetical protein
MIAIQQVLKFIVFIARHCGLLCLQNSPISWNVQYIKKSQTMSSVHHKCIVTECVIKRCKYLFCAVLVGFHFRMRRNRMVKTASPFLLSRLASSSSYCYHRRYMGNLYCLLFSCLHSIRSKVFWILGGGGYPSPVNCMICVWLWSEEWSANLKFMLLLWFYCL